MKIELCEICHGKGYNIFRNDWDPYDHTYAEIRCGTCMGSGRMKKQIISYTNGPKGAITVIEISPYEWSPKE